MKRPVTMSGADWLSIEIIVRSYLAMLESITEEPEFKGDKDCNEATAGMLKTCSNIVKRYFTPSLFTEHVGGKQ